MKKIALIFSAALLTACAANSGYYAQQNQTKFVSLGPLATSAVTCSALQETKQADGRLRVKANVQNRVNKRIQVQIRCVFKDEQGFSIDETPFQRLILTELGQQTVPFESLKANVVNFTVEVRLTH